MALSVSGIVRVSINLTPLGAQGRSFGTLMIAGDSSVISGTERFRTYLGIAGVASDFGTTAPEYLAAALYFEQSPSPATLMIGRWLRTAAAALNDGGFLTPAEQAISSWTAISAGAFTIVIDGTTVNLTGLDFTGTTNLNGVASVITTGLSGGQTCIWNGTNFVIQSGTTGAGTAATGTVTFTTNVAAADTLTLNGITITFVSSGPTGNQVLVGSSATATAANLQLFLNASTNASLVVAAYSTVGTVLTVTYNTVGTGGNAYTIAKSSTHLTISGANLAGGAVPSSVGYATSPGSGTDISAQLMLTAATSQALVPGYSAETPVQCAAALANLSTAWYGLMFAASVAPTDQQSLSVSSFIEGLDITRIYGVTTQNTNALSALVTNDLGSLMQDAAYNQSFIQYSSSTPYAVASLFGRAFTVDYTASNTTIILMFKQEPGVTAEVLTQNQALVLQNKSINVFVAYDDDTNILQYGTMSSGEFLDTIQGVDWLQNAIQTAVYNVLYTSPKVPQTDAGVNQLTAAIAGVCNQGVGNGFIAPGIWNATGFGQLQQGQYLKSGFYIFAASVNTQSQEDRQARKAPPIQVAVKLAGGIQSVDVLVSVNQ